MPTPLRRQVRYHAACLSVKVGDYMNEGWIVLGVCIVFVLGAALPLIRGSSRNDPPPPPPKETLRDWRKGD